MALQGINYNASLQGHYISKVYSWFPLLSDDLIMEITEIFLWSSIQLIWACFCGHLHVFIALHDMKQLWYGLSDRVIALSDLPIEIIKRGTCELAYTLTNNETHACCVVASFSPKWSLLFLSEQHISGSLFINTFGIHLNIYPLMHKNPCINSILNRNPLILQPYPIEIHP